MKSTELINFLEYEFKETLYHFPPCQAHRHQFNRNPFPMPANVCWWLIWRTHLLIWTHSYLLANVHWGSWLVGCLDGCCSKRIFRRLSPLPRTRITCFNIFDYPPAAVATNSKAIRHWNPILWGKARRRLIRWKPKSAMNTRLGGWRACEFFIAFFPWEVDAFRDFDCTLSQCNSLSARFWDLIHPFKKP